MNNFEMGFNNPSNHDEDESKIKDSIEEENLDDSSSENINRFSPEDFALLLEKFSKKENTEDISPENYDLLLKKLSKVENLDDNKEAIEELKNVEESELSSIETKKPFASKLRKTLLIITTALVLMSATPAFAASSENIQYDNQRIEKSESTGLEFNESTRMITYTYIVKDNINFNDYFKDRKLKAFATAEFGGVLQRKLDRNSIKLSGVDYEYQPGRVIMTMNFDNFCYANSDKTESSSEKHEAESVNVKSEKHETVIAKNVSTIKTEPEKSINSETKTKPEKSNVESGPVIEKPNFPNIEDPFILKEGFAFINYKGIDYFAFTASSNFDPSKEKNERFKLRTSAARGLKESFEKEGDIELKMSDVLVKSDGENSKFVLLIPISLFVENNLANVESNNNYTVAFKSWYL